MYVGLHIERLVVVTLVPLFLRCYTAIKLALSHDALNRAYVMHIHAF